MAMSVVYSTFCGQIVSELRGGVERDYMPDTLGSTAALLDGSQNQTDTWTYSAYGEVLSRTGTNPTPFTFVGTLGYFKDMLDKLLYVRARFYQPNFGRWLTVDSLWPKEPDYVYVHGQPITMTDPLGLAPFCACRPTPHLRGISFGHPKYDCYLRGCKSFCRCWDALPSDPFKDAHDKCQGAINCCELNKTMPVCDKASDPTSWETCGKQFTEPGGTWYNGEGANQSNYPDPVRQVGACYCCVECRMRACCMNLRNQQGCLDVLNKRWAKC